MIRKFPVFLLAILLTVGSFYSPVVLAMEEGAGEVDDATQTQLHSEMESVLSEEVVAEALESEGEDISSGAAEEAENELQSIVEEIPGNSIMAASTRSVSYKSQFDINDNPLNAIVTDEAEYMLTFDVNRPGANHDGITTAYDDGWWVSGSPIHDENWDLTSFTVDIELHVAGQAETQVKQMSLTVNNSAAEPWDKYVWNGKVTFDAVGVP